jgi:transposase-like protein/DNA-directed RNA polymerase subunit RPC12/RpoP
MAIITLRLITVNEHPTTRPAGCRYCGHAILQKWGTVLKAVRDTQLHQVRVTRYRCAACHRTFRHYPAGIQRADQSLRLQQLAAVCWRLGLSTRAVSGLFTAFQTQLAHMTVWRDVQMVAQQQATQSPAQKVRVLGVDGLYGRVAGRTQALTLAVDMGTGAPLALAQLDEHDVQAVVDWLKPIVTELGIEVIVTDDLKEYGRVAEQLGVQHQVCHFHVLRWVRKTLKELHSQVGAEWQTLIQRVQTLVRDLPAAGTTELFAMYQQLPAVSKPRSVRASPLHRLRQLVLRLCTHWERYTLYQHADDIPATNNRTEQAIGRWRTRSRSVRGFKSAAGLQSAFWLCASSGR